MKRKADTTTHHRRDGLLILAVTAALSLLIAAGTPIGCALSLMGSYHRFVQGLDDSLVYAREHDSLALTVDGAAQPVQMEQVSALYQLICDTGMGSPLSEAPKDVPSLTITFGDGSALSCLPTTIDEPDGTKADGAIVSYTYKDGNVFSYDTDQLVYQDLLARLTTSTG